MNQLAPSSKFRFPTLGLIVIAVVLIALTAIFVFKVPFGQVFLYGLLAFMILSYFWTPGRQSNPNDHLDPGSTLNTSASTCTSPFENDDPQNRRHGCH